MNNAFDIALALLYLGIAATIFDRVLAAMKQKGFFSFLKFWFLAIALGLFGLGRMTGTELFYNLAHPCLIAYAGMQVYRIAYGNQCRWWRQD